MLLSLTIVLASQLQPPQLAAPDLSVVNLEANRAGVFTDHLAQQLTQLGLTVVSSRQIGALLGQERQKQLLGCAETATDCMAELANALGSDAVVTGSIAKIDATFQVNISVISAKDGKPLSVLSSSENTEAGVLAVMSREAPRIAQEVFAKLRPGQRLVLPSPGVRRVSWIPAAAGAVLLAVGAGLTLSAHGDSDRLRGSGLAASSMFTRTEAQDLASAGQTKQTVGMALGAVGIAACVAGLGMFVFGGSSEARITVAGSPDGAAFVFAGAW